MCLCRSQPEILSRATAKLKQFIQDPKTRLKQMTPDLGELIIFITLVLVMAPVDKAPITWELIRGPFLQEAVTRNARWVLNRAPELQVMETGPSDYRIETTFTCKAPEASFLHPIPLSRSQSQSALTNIRIFLVSTDHLGRVLADVLWGVYLLNMLTPRIS